MTFWILLAIAAILSFMSLRYINILLSLGASMGWLSLMAYNLTTPPAGIAVGSAVHEWLTLVFIIIAIAVMYMWFRQRGRTESVTRVGMGEGEIVAHTTKREGVSGRSLMGMSEDEYRDDVRRALRTRGRRRLMR